MPHFHIPLQSGSDEVLKLMHRRYDRELFAGKIRTIRHLLPDAFIGVDVIAGMRGETEACFEDALRFIETLDISRLHVFPYSERREPKRWISPLTVPQEEKHRRVNRLISVSQKKINRFLSPVRRGETRPVLFEDNKIGQYICGFTDNYIKVKLPLRCRISQPDYSHPARKRALL